jgi:hypothetical protein
MISLKRLLILTLCIGFGIFLSACDGPTTPNLSAYISSVGDPSFDDEGNILVPMKMYVYNDGRNDAATSKVAVYAKSEDSGTGLVDFTVAGNVDAETPFTGLIYGKKSATLEGYLTFPGQTAGQTVIIFAEADSCVNETGLPPYCRVQEVDETDNQSNTVEIVLPDPQSSGSEGE